MKNYRKEKEMKFVGGVALSLVLCVLSTTTTFAAAEGFKAGYEKVFDDTKVEVEEEVIEYEEAVEYEEYFDMEKYKDYEIVQNDDTYDVKSKEDGKIKGDVGKGMIQASQVYAKKDQSVVITVSITPSDKTVRVGIVDNNNKIRFVYGKGTITHEFAISASGYYTPVVINDSNSTISVNGTYYVN